ncbi:4'-phosphopantetheinyl transferase family protein [Streptomyces sp. NBC_01198]|uniref:4'-phosphopantetheinyl transferase family protein n=1 Tax=Streptomyces sp. NBC_01198 TaxID=2903769 RepID=UPI002E1679E1|nr:4'-phosphopantetheinyl transferase superfamily protein [Streptomyces sp. NBC_01198]
MTGALDEVDVWLVPDQRAERVLSGLLALLDAGERARADAYRSADDRRRYVVAHGALRLIVAAHLGAPAREIRWVRGPHGKPELAGRWCGARVNLSHSGDFAVVALTASRPVGVDVQRVLPHLAADAMAHRYFSPEEAASVRGTPDAASRAALFADLWARKEALVKAHGGRLTEGLRVPVTPTVPPAAPRPENAWAAAYRVTPLPAPPGYRAALALAGHAEFQVTPHQWTWPGHAP